MNDVDGRLVGRDTGIITITKIRAPHRRAPTHPRGADEEALPLLDLLPEGAGRASLYRTFAQGWARDDPHGASEWLEELPTGRERDQAVQGYSWALLASDPEGALVRATAIDEPRRREDQLRALAQQWLRRDPEAAAAWLGSSDVFSAYVPERLQRPAGK